MLRKIRRRLEMIEAKIPREPTEEDTLKAWLWLLIRCSVAYYVGEPKPKESMVDAFKRALGYEDAFAFNRACRPNNPEFDKRFNAAKEKVFAKFGIDDYRNCDWGAFVDALRRMEAGLSDSYKRILEKSH